MGRVQPHRSFHFNIHDVGSVIDGQSVSRWVGWLVTLAGWLAGSCLVVYWGRWDGEERCWCLAEMRDER